MADDDVLVAEVEADPIEPNNRIADLLSAIEKDNHVEAERTFNDLLGDRLGDALDQRKVALAQSSFNGVEDEAETETEIDDENFEISDEEVEAELDLEEPSEETPEE